MKVSISGDNINIKPQEPVYAIYCSDLTPSDVAGKTISVPGDETIYWFRVDGVGEQPPGYDVTRKIDILGTDDFWKIAEKTAFAFLVSGAYSVAVYAATVRISRMQEDFDMVLQLQG